jgi:gliding motility-associated-like protein
MVREYSDGGYALSMISLNFGADYYDPVFVKTDSMGVVGCNEANCATIVNNVTPSVASGMQEMVPAITATDPTLQSHSYSATDIMICRHCVTVPAFIPSDTTVCVGQPMFFYNTTTIGVRCFEDWYVNGTLVNGDKDTLPFIFNTSGSKQIQLIASCGNSTDTSTIHIHVYDYPVAGFTNTSVCNGTATQFTNASTTPTGSISAQAWNFGDTSPVNTTLSPSHTYLNPGNYTTTLIVSNFIGCADTATKPVKVYYNPIAGFIFSDVCYKDSMHFTNTSTVDTSTSITTYLWAFGDGATSGLKNPVHYYSSHGTYNVTLVTTTADGCSNAVTHAVNNFDPPHSLFTFNNTCLLNTAVFTNTTNSPTMGTTASWSWNFGDGSPLNTTVLSPQHLYGAPGNYAVTLITHSSNLGCPDTLMDSITVFPMPVAKFGFADVCLKQPMDFHDSSTVSSGSVVGWSWNFGDATALNTLQNPSHIYASPGTYQVTLIVTTNNGCKDTALKNNLVIHPLPTAAFSRNNVCYGTPIQFNDHSTIPNTDAIQSWIWNFGDTSPINTTQSPSHPYATADSFHVKLLVISYFGCRDSITQTSVVNPNPSVSFRAIDTIGCEPLCVSFQDLSIIATGGVVQWAWDFGDGSPISHSQNFVHCYVNNDVFKPDTLSVTLTATSDSACVSAGTRIDIITVYPNPVANFKIQPQSTSIIDPVISITDQSVGTNIWNWNFGDNDTTSKPAPIPHTYQDTGTYRITLIASTLYNCKDTAYQTVIIEPDFVFYIPNSFSPNDDGINDSFSGKGIFIKQYEMSIFDRWGNMIFYTDDINKPWDGTANHGTEMAQVDVYVYSINVVDYNKKKHSYKGIVTLVK